MSEFEDSGGSRECSENTVADDTTTMSSAGRQSIIGKMKSRVSGIIPNKISNWFKSTSSTTQNTEDNSLNGSDGSLATVDTSNNRSRSRIELREDDYDDEEWASGEDEDGYVNYEEAALADNIAEHDVDNSEAQTHSDYAINMLRQETHTLQKRPGIRARERDDDDDDDDIDDIEGETNTAAPQSIKSSSTLYPSNLSSNSNPIYGKRTSYRQPEMKRTRLSNDFSIRDSPMVNRHSFIASTPAVSGGAFMRNSSTAMLSSGATATRSRYNYMNLYRNQNKREPAYNFGAATTEAALATSGDLPTTTDSNVNVNRRIQSSRRSLLIPTSSEQQQQQRYHLPIFRRQALSTVRSSDSDTLIGATPGIIREQDETSERTANQRNHFGQTININNNNINVKMNSINARQNLLNGDSRGIGVSTDVVSLDTASEASNEEQVHNKDNGIESRSRTSSFGNSGINFEAHLQGPKSLFSGTTNPPRQGPHQQINNSTMSLNSLNYRRQFNASVYGSTSALSDSRLYNTLSPFYKGRTTYGGASAYNSYNKIFSGNDGNTDAGTSFLRLKPTVIRPQSSLSTLSSSSNSGAGITVNRCGITTISGEQINISNTAQRILSLLNDFSSPLTEARKMGNNLRDYHDMMKSKRLTEADLESSRKNRLAQIRSPYLRPSPYQPSGSIRSSNGNGNGNGNSSSSSPVISAPVRELQLPKITNWLKMRQQMASSSERIRKIAMDEPVNDFFKTRMDYKLPVGRDCDRSDGGKVKNAGKGDNNDGNNEQQQQQQKQYQEQQQPLQQLRQIKQTGKIRQKVLSNARVTSCIDDRRLDETLPPVNLPNIAFPLMQSIPKFDIELPKPIAGANLLSSASSATSIQSRNAFVQPSSSLKRTKESSITDNQSSSFIDFKFSLPIALSTPKESLSLIPISKNFKFSEPINSNVVVLTNSKNEDKSTNKKKTKANNETKNSYSSDDDDYDDVIVDDDDGWKCESCGKVFGCSSISFCIFCLTPRAKRFTTSPKEDSSVKVPILYSPATISSTKTTIPTNNLLQFSSKSNFGNELKKSSSEWECDICMVRNKEPTVRCVACETPRMDINITPQAPILTPAPSNKNLFSASNSFGSAFKPKADTWECSVCLIVNTNDTDKCMACETKRTGALTAVADDGNNKKLTVESSEKPKFQFGFATPAANANKTTEPAAVALTAPAPIVAADDTFKSLVAAQKTSKWSCSACFAQNDAVRKKCICCEEPKPGTLVTPDGGLKFNFGSNPSVSVSDSQFKFGFANNTTTTAITTTVVSSLSTSTATADPVSTVASTTSFCFGNRSTTSIFTSGSDTADGTTKSKSSFIFGFGSGTSGYSSSITSVNTDVNDVNDVKPTKSVTFNLPTENATVTAVGIPSTGFKLGSSLPSSSSSSSSSLETVQPSIGTSATSTTSGFAFTPISTKSSSTVATESSIATSLTNSGIVATTSTTPLPISIMATIAESPVGTVISNAGGTSAAVPNTFQFGSFSSATTTNSTAISTPTNSAMSAFAVNPVNSSLSTNTVAENPTAAAITTSAVSATATAITTASSTSTTSTGIFNFSQSAAASTTPSFIFGSQPAVGVTSTVAKTTASIFGPTTSTINNSFAPNPSSTFIFGGSGETHVLGSGAAPAAGTSIGTGATPTISANKDTAAASTSNIFGNFDGDKTPTTSTFGAPATLGAPEAVSTASPSSSLFNAAASNNQTGFSTSATPAGNSGFATIQNMPVFGGTTPKFGVGAENSNIFGSSNSSSSNNLRTFGMESTSSDGMMQQQQQQAGTTFGSFGSSSSSVTAHIGPTPAKQKPYVSFGAAAAAAAGSPATTFGKPTEMPKPASFNFTAPNAAAPSTSGIFNFSANSGSTTANSMSSVPTLKPAFNFTATPPIVNFNFTGTSSINPTSNNDHPYAANNRPFIFGTTTTTTTNPEMVMGMGMGMNNTMSSTNNNNPASYLNSFGANNGMMEASSNAPFQFNAGAAPTANIFAINPTTSGGPGSQTAAQQARRKIRTPNRRLTPR